MDNNEDRRPLVTSQERMRLVYNVAIGMSGDTKDYKQYRATYEHLINLLQSSRSIMNVCESMLRGDGVMCRTAEGGISVRTPTEEERNRLLAAYGTIVLFDSYVPEDEDDQG